MDDWCIWFLVLCCFIYVLSGASLAYRWGLVEGWGICGMLWKIGASVVSGSVLMYLFNINFVCLCSV